MAKQTIINKGNYTMESRQREARFETILAEGWKEQYLQYRRNWRRYAKQCHVSDYPLLVDIELSSLCNLRCPMCYTITPQFKRRVQAQLMDVALFKKIIDEIGGNVPALRLSLRGESTLHPQFVDCIRHAKRAGIGEVSFLTNGSRLSADYFQQIMEAGADWITLSVDGIGPEYEKIRSPLTFAKTFERIKTMHALKQKAGRVKPAIKAQTIWPAIRHDPAHYYHLLAPWVDLIAFNPLIDFHCRDDDIDYLEDFYCPQHYQRLTVGSDGRVMMCANDENSEVVIGNAAEQRIYDIWHGAELNSLRAIHQSRYGFKQLDVCRRCYLPRTVNTSETSVVDGRRFAIQNYGGSGAPETNLQLGRYDHSIAGKLEGYQPLPGIETQSC
jgi:radical SAM protein with 4Fe4S-binding SPASM domain